MKFPKLKKWQWIVIAVLGILIITNPGISSFKQFCGASSNSNVRRTSNFFLFSTYSYSSDMFIGLFGNFIEIPDKQNSSVSVSFRKEEPVAEVTNKGYDSTTKIKHQLIDEYLSKRDNGKTSEWEKKFMQKYGIEEGNVYRGIDVDSFMAKNKNKQK